MCQARSRFSGSTGPRPKTQETNVHTSGCEGVQCMSVCTSVCVCDVTSPRVLGGALSLVKPHGPSQTPALQDASCMVPFRNAAAASSSHRKHFYRTDLLPFPVQAQSLRPVTTYGVLLAVITTQLTQNTYLLDLKRLPCSLGVRQGEVGRKYHVL